jgi:hypothetical protein
MILRNGEQSLRFILSVMSACTLVACSQDAFVTRVPTPPAKDPCVEAADYGRRAAAANDANVKAGLQRIADSRSRECAAKTGETAGPSAPSNPASSGASE